VRLNNIQYALLKLDALQNNIDVESLAAILERNSPTPTRREEKQTYIFTIKVVSAEDLKPCDVNGFSDPYVVLTNEHGKRIAKTRTIWRDLNPRWEETFDVSTTGSLWLAATVWDRDKLVKNHDLVGRCYVKLDPSYFGDYLPRVSSVYMLLTIGFMDGFGYSRQVVASCKYGR
jgi:C2 domain